MTEKKAHEVDGWLKRPDPSMSVVLIYGPDRGLVSERASAYARGTGLALDDPFSVIRLDGPDIEKAPERLQVEAGTVPMFGGDRLIWIRNAGQGSGLANEIKALCDAPPPDTRILIEAGELKKGTGLRGLVERARNAVALPCYGDEGRSLDAVIDEMLGSAGLRIDTDARQLLKSGLGGDRLATRGEIEKLLLYCRGQQTVSVEDVAAATGDASETGADALIDAVLLGDRRALHAAFAALSRTGSLGGLPIFLQRQFQQMSMLRHTVDAGASVSSAVASARPPIFFSRRKGIEAALSRWPGDVLAEANRLIFNAILRTRRVAASADAEFERLLLQLSSLPSARR